MFHIYFCSVHEMQRCHHADYQVRGLVYANMENGMWQNYSSSFNIYHQAASYVLVSTIML